MATHQWDSPEHGRDANISPRLRWFCLFHHPRSSLQPGRSIRHGTAVLTGQPENLSMDFPVSADYVKSCVDAPRQSTAKGRERQFLACLSDVVAIGPARDGALRVLKARRQARRHDVVGSGDCLWSWRPRCAVHRGDWSDETNLSDTGAYERSRTMAERAAWAWLTARGRCA